MINDTSNNNKVRKNNSRSSTDIYDSFEDNDTPHIMESMIKKIHYLEEKVNELEINLQKEKLEKLNAYKKLYEEYTYIEDLLLENAQLKDRYTALVNSKLGRITLKYWKVKNKGRR